MSEMSDYYTESQMQRIEQAAYDGATLEAGKEWERQRYEFGATEAELAERVAELEAEVTNGHELQDAYCDRIAELEATVEIHADISNAYEKRISEIVSLSNKANAKLQARIAELEAENDELKERVAMLDVNSIYKSLAEMGYIEQVYKLNSRIAECESALISMVQQFFYNKDGEDAFRHAFMSAEEEAAEYLVEHGIARWAGKNKSAICFNGVQA